MNMETRVIWSLALGICAGNVGTARASEILRIL